VSRWRRCDTLRHDTYARLRVGTAPLRGAAPCWRRRLPVALLICRNAMRSAVEHAACSAIGQETRGKFEVAFPVRTHNQFLLLQGYACEEVCKGSDALFDPVAGPLRPARVHFLFGPCAGGVPLPRARAKNRGPLQAVPVMARAMAERLG
jgi:hypothetical protein